MDTISRRRILGCGFPPGPGVSRAGGTSPIRTKSSRGAADLAAPSSSAGRTADPNTPYPHTIKKDKPPSLSTGAALHRHHVSSAPQRTPSNTHPYRSAQSAPNRTHAKPRTRTTGLVAHPLRHAINPTPRRPRSTHAAYKPSCAPREIPHYVVRISHFPSTIFGIF